MNLTPVQQQATHPQQSIWLAAHAGTGKTRVLVDRMLRLLLSGEPPSGLVAITYTRAAAAEMQQRLRSVAARWAQADEVLLRDELSALQQAVPDAEILNRARGLLRALTEAQPGLQIQTIHGFCQSLLSRFPLEAGLSGPPEVMDDRMRVSLLAEARGGVFEAMAISESDELRDAATLLAQQLGDGGLNALIDTLIERSRGLFAEWSRPGGAARYMDALGAMLGANEAIDRALTPAMTSQVAELLADGGKKDSAFAEILQSFTREEVSLETYAAAFLTREGERKKQLVSKASREKLGALAEQLDAEQEWAYTYHQAQCDEAILALSEVAAILGQALLARYEAAKSERGWLDYHDLLHHSIQLLSRPGICEWVLSKLDWQLKHLLLDEAQDTSPEQWRLLQLMTEELFVPELYDGSPRTLFVVGDFKQSIYRFQGADPEGFRSNATHYAHWFTQSDQAFHALTLDTSFRSTAPVLALVDEVCGRLNLPAEHEVHRSEQPGAVSLWPLVEHVFQEVCTPWDVPGEVIEAQSASQQLAEQIAADIEARIDRGEYAPEDVLILVQRRSAFMKQLRRALQKRSVPVAGADRLKLLEHLAVKDVLTLADWCLCSEDDLALATVLKGPLFQISEEALFELSHGREGTLWQSLQENGEYQAIAETLNELAEMARAERPYEWLRYLLDSFNIVEPLRAELGLEADDALGELCALALQFETQSTPSLALFVDWLQRADIDIKREMEQGAGAVRMMTVHGAKGLQAPLVYLPDTVRVPTAQESMVWYEADGSSLLLVPPQGQLASTKLRAIKQAERAADAEEYARLLYVALTRAEDELVIAGYETGRKTPDNCWYMTLEQAMQQLGEKPNDDGVLHLTNGTREVTQPNKEAASFDMELPDWWHQSPSKATTAKIVHSPSMLLNDAHEEVPVGDASDGDGCVRGNIIHQLLQIMPPDGASFNEAHIKKLLPDATEEMVAEALAVCREHAWLFGPESQAEVTLQGEVLWQGNAIYLRGQIDRLIVEPSRVVIVDYKSNRQVPDEIPQSYLAQLAAYRALLVPLYPNRVIEAGLLWTASGRLQLAETSQMDALCQPSAAALDSPAA